ncbi:superoxide dismutase family protein [Sphingomicrobium astaxanthinifaciens]|uniref:superoxide dismutase family protein n=1 Tax=Sphingomicrobium astaxanthinifaciens TaxID=1227949 RepID=UPI001FCB9F8C|nr:superoxide dismutase family protein [Sphingomicrobium astaxanthinifaciens]MCJ7421574.1 superoxide dismutase family protein [Sphingomicrobium astaxanthinifaciens]
MTCKSFLCAAAAIPLLAAPAASQPEKITNPTHVAELDALNGSGVTGRFIFQERGNRYLQVRIEVEGLEAGGIHLAHIHGSDTPAGAVGDAICPTIASDSDGDGFVELGEGLPLYGGIVVDFDNIDDDLDGSVSTEITIDLNEYINPISGENIVKGDLRPLELGAVVVHGLTVPGGVNDGLPTGGYLISLPVACGEIERRERRDPFEFREAPGD